MTIRHAQFVAEVLGLRRLTVLTDVFRNCRGQPPLVRADRYRADHIDWIDVLDELIAQRAFLQRDRTSQHYTVRFYALPLIDDDHAKRLVAVMEQLFALFRKLYGERLSEPIAVSKIIELATTDPVTTLDALYYITDAHGIWSGHFNDFPYGANAAMSIAEAVLRKNSVLELFSEFYEWHFVNARKRAASQPEKLLRGPSESSGFFEAEADAQRPLWYSKLDDTKKALIEELDFVTRHGLSALPTMGLRTLVESIMRDAVGDKGSFTETLRAFRDAGHITGKDAELIEIVIEAGHAAAHRAHFPSESDIAACVHLVRHLAEHVYVLRPQLDDVARRTPKRDRGMDK